jgi:hypothetical protein
MARCKLDLCLVAVDGKCIEGRGATCPNLIIESQVVAMPESTGVGDIAANSEEAFEAFSDNLDSSFIETEALHPGTSLDLADARDITRRSRAVLVSIAGMAESGKTSLLARFHQQFQMGPVGDYEFAGSRTLMRFEELNWRATVESGADTPSMDHTSRRYDNSCLHVAVQHKDGHQPHIDLLLNDISGDTYPDAISALSVCETLLCMRRADHLAVVVDGGAMVDRHRRHDHSAKAVNFVDLLLQTGQIGSQTMLHLIITKQDELNAEPEDAASHKTVKSLEDTFQNKFKSQVAVVHNWRIAARPLDGTMPTTETIAALFSKFVSSTNRYPMPQRTDRPLVEGFRDFSRFGLHAEGLNE